MAWCRKCGGAKFIPSSKFQPTDTIYINVNIKTTRGQIHQQVNMYKGMLKFKSDLKYTLNYTESNVYTEQEIEDMLNG